MNDVKEKPKGEMASRKKWGNEVIGLGFCIIPALLFRAQSRLGLNPTQLTILLQIADYWWQDDRKPHPSKRGLSERLGLGERQIQRHVADLEKRGLVRRIERRGANQGKLTNEYDLSGLVKKLKALAPEFIEVKNDAQQKRRDVSKRGGLKAAKRIADSKKETNDE